MTLLAVLLLAWALAVLLSVAIVHVGSSADIDEGGLR